MEDDEVGQGAVAFWSMVAIWLIGVAVLAGFVATMLMLAYNFGPNFWNLGAALFGFGLLTRAVTF